jgi:hypothetical protein
MSNEVPTSAVMARPGAGVIPTGALHSWISLDLLIRPVADARRMAARSSSLDRAGP